jgi:threonylcarbamoyladenosine tRNA methylthiotransferase MtaB
VEPDKDRVTDRVGLALGVGPLPDRSVSRTGTGFHTRSMVKVEDGCDAGCSYCIVPLVRGEPHPSSFESVVSEVRTLVDAGTVEVVLTGVNIGRYGDSGRDLADLVRAVADTGVPRLRLSSIEPQDLDARLIETLASLEAFCPHLHVPLQSGSDRVLTAMCRSYDADAFRRTIVFRFSSRRGTAAAEMTGVVPLDLRRSRATELRGLGDRLRLAYMESRLGEHADVLIERAAEDRGEGTTRDYLKVTVARSGLAIGAVEDVVLRSVDGSRMSAA